MCQRQSEPCNCLGCQQDWLRHFSGDAEGAYLNSIDPEKNGYIPASDKEWQEFLDEIAPRVNNPNNEHNG